MAKIIRLTESDLTRLVRRVINNSDVSKNIKEDFDPMAGIDNFLNNPVIIALATAWLLKGRYKIDNLKSNIDGMKNDFLDYCNSIGYTINNEVLDFHFNQLIKRVKKIIKI